MALTRLAVNWTARVRAAVSGGHAHRIGTSRCQQDGSHRSARTAMAMAIGCPIRRTPLSAGQRRRRFRGTGARGRGQAAAGILGFRRRTAVRGRGEVRLAPGSPSRRAAWLAVTGRLGG